MTKWEQRRNTIEMAVYERQAEILPGPFCTLSSYIGFSSGKKQPVQNESRFLDLPKNITQHMNVLKKREFWRNVERNFKYHTDLNSSANQRGLFIPVLLHQTTIKKNPRHN